jgi:hypothetical protein
MTDSERHRLAVLPPEHPDDERAALHLAMAPIFRD